MIKSHLMEQHLLIFFVFFPPIPEGREGGRSVLIPQ